MKIYIVKKIEEKTFRTVSNLEMVSRVTGISRRTLYYTFGTKGKNEYKNDEYLVMMRMLERSRRVEKKRL